MFRESLELKNIESGKILERFLYESCRFLICIKFLGFNTYEFEQVWDSKTVTISYFSLFEISVNYLVNFVQQYVYIQTSEII